MVSIILLLHPCLQNELEKLKLSNHPKKRRRTSNGLQSKQQSWYPFAARIGAGQILQVSILAESLHTDNL